MLWKITFRRLLNVFILLEPFLETHGLCIMELKTLQCFFFFGFRTGFRPTKGGQLIRLVRTGMHTGQALFPLGIEPGIFPHLCCILKYSLHFVIILGRYFC
jgi:hypothetical protein